MKDINKIINKTGIDEYYLLKDQFDFHNSELIKITVPNNHSIFISKISIIEIAKDIL